MRTKGKWKVTKGIITQWVTDANDNLICDYLSKYDAEFIALAGTIANQLDEQGIDGEKAIEMLPEILNLMTNPWNDCFDKHCGKCAYCKEKEIRKKLQLPQLHQPLPEQPAEPDSEPEDERRRRLDGKGKSK